MSAGPSKLAMHCCPSLAFALPDTWSAVTPTLSAGLESSMSRVVELPLHMFTVALEEHLLLSAFRHLLGCQVCAACPPALTMATRNDIVQAALNGLSGSDRTSFLQYADELSASLGGETRIRFPSFPAELVLRSECDAAEQRARDYLRDGSGCLWTALREVISELPFSPDERSFGDGGLCVFGAYSKGGIKGLTKHTVGHPATCILINAAILSIDRTHTWSSFAVTANNCTEVHCDRWNEPGAWLLFGVSHHDGGELWMEDPAGAHYREHAGNMVPGSHWSTSAVGVTFDSCRLLHATNQWFNGSRVMVIAYTAQRPQTLLPGTAQYLTELGFMLPAACTLATGRNAAGTSDCSDE